MYIFPWLFSGAVSSFWRVTEEMRHPCWVGTAARQQAEFEACCVRWGYNQACFDHVFTAAECCTVATGALVVPPSFVSEFLPDDVIGNIIGSLPRWHESRVHYPK